MTTATIYKLHSGFTNVSDAYELDDWHVDEFRGDYALEVELPADVHVAVNGVGQRAIFDDAGEPCTGIFPDGRHGTPILVYPARYPYREVALKVVG